jgi:hypothetical protein
MQNRNVQLVLQSEWQSVHFRRVVSAWSIVLLFPDFLRRERGGIVDRKGTRGKIFKGVRAILHTNWSQCESRGEVRADNGHVKRGTVQRPS